MKITEHIDKITRERYVSFRHKSGVKVLIAPNGYSTACAVYCSDYGGSDTKFRYNGKIYDTPRGIAHFLEHKLFETEDGGDAFKLFTDNGADSNAFTSQNSTAFNFTSSTADFYRCLEILLDFVHHPHFTDESVDKERGIIAEELKMYEDNPDVRCYYELMKCLYKNCSARYDVGGTLGSINEITPDLLYFCHKVFYSPSNMSLIVSGDIDINRLIKIMDGTVPDIRSHRAETVIPDEPEKVYKRSSVLKMEVSSPLFSFGVKDVPSPDKKVMRRKAAALSILLDMIFGESSEFYCELYEKGLLSGDIETSYSRGDDHAYLSVSGESSKPHTVKRRIIETIEKTIEQGVDDAEFTRCKKVFYANFVYSLQNSQSAAFSYLTFCREGDDMLKYPALLSSINANDAVSYLKQIYNADKCAFTVIKPDNQGG
ncbi:MAG: insulinase family protein [Clostridia bacterium]|nr:insulinase family protein [Clostridia bacterium]